MIAWVSAGRGKTGISPLEIGITNQIFPEKNEVGILIPINWFDSCNGRFFCRYETHTAQESGSQCHAVMSLQQGCNEVRLRPGQEASLAPPCSNVMSFGRKFTVLKKVIVKLLGNFGGPSRHLASPAVIRRPHNDPAPGEFCPPVAPGLQFTNVPSFACTGGLRKSRAAFLLLVFIAL